MMKYFTSLTNTFRVGIFMFIGLVMAGLQANAAGCNANAGTGSVTGNGLVNVGTNSYNLMYDSTIVFTTSNFVLPPNGGKVKGGTCTAGVMYAIYAQDPTSFFPLNSSNYNTVAGYLTSSQTANGVTNDKDSAGSSQSALQLKLGSYSNLWFVPFVVPCTNNGANKFSLAVNNDSCYAFGTTAIKVHYLPPVKTPKCETDTTFTQLIYSRNQYSFSNPVTSFSCNSKLDTIYKNIHYAEDSIGYAGVEDLMGFYLHLSDSTGSMAQSYVTIKVNGKPYDYYGPAANYPVGGGLNWGTFGTTNAYQVMEPYIPGGDTVTVQLCSNNNAAQHYAYYVVDYATGKQITTTGTGGAVTSKNNCVTFSFVLSKPYTKWTLDGDSSIIRNLNNGAAVFNPAALSAGTHIITYYFNNGAGCTLTAHEKITVTNGVQATATGVNPGCANNNGSAKVTFFGGTAPYTYSWTTGASGTTTAGSVTLNNLAGGTYTVTITDSKACHGTSAVTLTGATPPTANISSSNNPSCSNVANGFAIVAVTAGTQPFTYNWSGTNGAVTFKDSAATGLAAGSYTVTVTDAKSCTAITSVTLVNNPAPTVSLSATSNSTCFGGNNGTALANPAAGKAPYTYNWSGSHGAVTFKDSSATNLAAGTYSVTITDANGCSASSNVSISQPNAYNFSQTSTVNASCGNSNGSAILTVSGSNGAPYQYSWSGPSGAVTYQDSAATGLASGSYTVTVADAKSCAQTATVHISNSTGTSVQITSNPPILCFGGNNGTASASISGGTSPYTYAWTAGATGMTTANTISANNLTAGLYALTVTDAVGCNSITPFSISQPNFAIGLTPTMIPAACGNAVGSIQVAVTGGTPAYSYQWAGTNGAVSFVDSLASNLAAGTYTVTVSDANACTSTLVVQDTATQLPILNPQPSQFANPTCFNGNNGYLLASLAITGTQPYTYSWAGPNGSFAANGDSIGGLTVGNYTVTLTDKFGCTSTAMYTLANNPGVTASLAVSDSVNPYLSCGTQNGNLTQLGSIYAKVTGGASPYSYAWSNSLSPLSKDTLLPAGIYTLTVTDASGAGCSAVVTDTVHVASQVSNLAIVQPNLNIRCYGDTTGTLMASYQGGKGPFTYQWTANSNLLPQNTDTIVNLAAGNYQLTVTDGFGCQTTSATAILQPRFPLSAGPNGIRSSPLTCGSDTAVLGVRAFGGHGPYSYLWSDNTNNLSILVSTAGTYSVIITDANGCKDTASITIPQYNKLQGGQLSITQTTTCRNTDGSMTVQNVTGGLGKLTYQWMPASAAFDSASIRNIASGQAVKVVVHDSLGCADTLSNSMPVTIPTATFAGSTNVNAPLTICNGSNEIVTANVTGGTQQYTYNWSTSSTNDTINVAPVANTTYSLTITDALNCSTVQTVAVAVTTVPAPVISTTAPNASTCNPAYDFTFNVTEPGNVPYANSPTVNWTFGTTQVAGAAGATSITHAFNATGTYTVSAAVTEAGCTVSSTGTTFTVSVNAALTGTISYTPAAPAVLLTTTPVQFSIENGNNNANVAWSFQDNAKNGDASDSISTSLQPLHTFKSAGTYCVRLAQFGMGFCPDTTWQCLDIKEPCIFPAKVPNVFSPNGDGINDYFSVADTGFSTLKGTIFNRWGESIATFSAIDGGNWNGKDRNGNEAPAGTYFYLFDGTCAVGGKEIKAKGTIELVR